MAKQKAPRANTIPAWVFLVLAVVLLGAAALGIWMLLSPQAQGGTGPALAVNLERLELGKHPFEQIVRAEFQIKNVGDRALTLDASAPVRALEGC